MHRFVTHVRINTGTCHCRHPSRSATKTADGRHTGPGLLIDGIFGWMDGSAWAADGGRWRAEMGDWRTGGMVGVVGVVGVAEGSVDGSRDFGVGG